MDEEDEPGVGLKANLDRLAERLHSVFRITIYFLAASMVFYATMLTGLSRNAFAAEQIWFYSVRRLDRTSRLTSAQSFGFAQSIASAGSPISSNGQGFPTPRWIRC